MTLCGVGGVGWGGGYDQLCCPASPKLLLGLDLGLGCDNMNLFKISDAVLILLCPKQVSLRV